MAQSLDVIKAELKRMASDGPTAAELDNAKNYLTGSYALRFDTNPKIANQLLASSRTIWASTMSTSATPRSTP